MKTNKRTLILSVITCLLPMLLGAALYGKLPEQMPIHFTIGDVPDNYAHKNFALFGIPVILAAIQALCLISVNLKTKELCEKPKILKIMEWFIPILTILIYVIMVQVPLSGTVYVGKSIFLILGILFIIIGNYMPKISYEAGKTTFHPMPKSEKAFRKMSRATGYTFIILGLIFLVMIIWV